jgi:hypothetical protein
LLLASHHLEEAIIGDRRVKMLGVVFKEMLTSLHIDMPSLILSSHLNAGRPLQKIETALAPRPLLGPVPKPHPMPADREHAPVVEERYREVRCEGTIRKR